MQMRRFGAIAGSLVAVTALAACGSSSSDIKTVSFTPLTQANFGSSVSSTVKGVKSAHMTMKASIMSFSADVSYGPPIAMQMSGTVTVQGRAMTMEMRMLGSVMYMQIPGETPAGKFMSIDLSKLPQTSGFFKALSQYQKMGPQSMLSQFKAGVKSVKYIGTEQINGQQARHYTVVIDTAAAVKAFGNSAALSQVSLPTTITEQVYLDAQKRPLRLTMPLPAPVGSMEMDFSNWGEAVHVEAPPTSKIMPIPMGAFGTSA